MRFIPLKLDLLGTFCIAGYFSNIEKTQQVSFHENVRPSICLSVCLSVRPFGKILCHNYIYTRLWLIADIVLTLLPTDMNLIVLIFLSSIYRTGYRQAKILKNRRNDEN